MSKKKNIIYVIVVLLLLLGLTIISFFGSNKNNETEEPEIEEKPIIEKVDDKEEEPITITEENDDKEEEKEDDKEDERIRVVVKDNSYDLALKAVSAAEKDLDKKSYEKALALVKKVRNGFRKDDLKERLQDVKETIDTIDKVNNLVTMTNDATNLEELNAARNYRDSKKVLKAVADLKAGELKTELQEKLDSLTDILEDLTAPVVSVNDGDVFDHQIKVTVTDDNEFTVVLTKDGETVEYDPEENLTDGAYTLVATDIAFNETEVNFIVDTTKPVIADVVDGTYYNVDVTPSVVEVNLDTVVLTKDEVEVTTYNVGDTLTEEGTYTIVATDVAGNTSDTVTFVIDKTAPVVTLNGNSNMTLEAVTDTYTENGAVATDNYDEETDAEIRTIKYNEFNSRSVSEVEDVDMTTPGVYNIYYGYTDKAGNEAIQVVRTVRVVDTTRPVITINPNEDGEVDYDLEYNVDTYTELGAVANDLVDGEVELTVSTILYLPSTGIIRIPSIVSSVDATKLGTYYVFYEGYTDKAGNVGRTTSGEYVFSRTISVVDSLAPSLVVGETVYGPETTETIYANDTFNAITVDAGYGVYRDYVDDVVAATISIEAVGSHTIRTIDNNGNEATYNILIDKTAPTLTIEGTPYGTDTVDTIITKEVVTDANIVETESGIDEIYVDGEEVDELNLDESGTYEVKLVDKAGNESEYTILVDLIAPSMQTAIRSFGPETTETIEGLFLFAAEAVDNESGIAKIYVNGVETNNIYLGKGTYTIRIVDNAGNETTFNLRVYSL